MNNTFNDVTLLHAYALSTPKTFSITDYKHRSMVIRLNSKLRYSYGSETIMTGRGDVVFIPRGATYTAKPISGNNEFMIVRFQTEAAGEWEVMHVDDLAEATALHTELCRAMVFNDRKSRMRALSCFYRILSMISEGSSEERYLPSRKLELIQPALDYIETNIFSSSLKIGDLHTLSGMSDVYFRELFRAHTGLTPQEYVTEKRLSRANELIASGASSKIKDVAAMVGYADALYFSRVYKMRYGHSPSHAKKDSEKVTREKQTKG